MLGNFARAPVCLSLALCPLIGCAAPAVTAVAPPKYVLASGDKPELREVMPVCNPASPPKPLKGDYRGLQRALQTAKRIYHFGPREQDDCTVPCGDGQTLCGDEAAAELRWKNLRHANNGPIVISVNTQRTARGVFTHYWVVDEEGEARHYYEDASDGKRWHVEDVTEATGALQPPVPLPRR